MILIRFPDSWHSHYSKLGPRLKVVALIDPNLDRCQTVLKEKRASFVQSAYKDTKVYKSIDEFHAGMTRDVRPK